MIGPCSSEKKPLAVLDLFQGLRLRGPVLNLGTLRTA